MKLTIDFFLFLIQFYPAQIQLNAYVTLGVLLLIQLTATLYTISVDTQDRRVMNSKAKRNADYVKISGVPVIDPETLICQICNVKVGYLTKHCKV